MKPAVNDNRSLIDLKDLPSEFDLDKEAVWDKIEHRLTDEGSLLRKKREILYRQAAAILILVSLTAYIMVMGKQRQRQRTRMAELTVDSVFRSSMEHTFDANRVRAMKMAAVETAKAAPRSKEEQKMYSPAEVQDSALLSGMQQPEHFAALVDSLILHQQLRISDQELLNFIHNTTQSHVEVAGIIAQATGLHARGLDSQALALLSEAARSFPANADLPYEQARIYNEQGNVRKAITQMETAISLNRRKPEWLYELGLMHASLQEGQPALRYLLMAHMTGLPSTDKFWQNLGIAYLNNGNLEDANRILEAVWKKDPENTSVLQVLAEGHYQQGKLTQALGYWEELLKREPGNVSALYRLGSCYQKIGNQDKAMEYFLKALEAYPVMASLKARN